MTSPQHQDHVVIERQTAKAKPPSMYKVLMLNDDYTPMEFVVMVLQSFFNKNMDEAYEIMMTVHTQGKAICGLYPKDIAATKVAQVIQTAQSEGHPLQCTMEEA